MTHYKNYSSYKERIRQKGYYSRYDDINFILVNCKAGRKLDNILLKDKNIISSTYDSCDIINKVISKLDNVLIIIDECHNLTDNNQEINNLIKTNNKILYMSATPTNNITYDNKYELSWDDAIKNNYICDYNFYYPNNEKIIEVIDNLKIDKNLILKTILINKAYFLLESIKLTNIKKCIVYLKTIKESIEFTKILQTLNIYFDFNIKVYEINYKTTSKNREKMLIKFKNDNTCINIICNVHILDEGIDIQECDSVYLTHPNNNPVNIIQRISRSNRLDVNNKDKISKIFIWSKNQIKLDQIINRLSNFIKIKYGKETNKVINNNDIIKKENIDTNLVTKKELENHKIIKSINNDKINNMENILYKCEICFKEYVTKSGLYKHNIKIHDMSNKIDCNYECRFCKKIFNSRQNKWSHEKICKIKDNSILSEQMKILSNKINRLENKSNIINNSNSNSNNNSNNNNIINDNRKQIIINYSPGKEPMNHLTIKQQKDIMNEGLNSLLHLIKLNNFDKNKPEFHSYCVTAINDKHANVLDIETQNVIKTDKIELYDTLLTNNLIKLKKISKNKLLSLSDRQDFSDKLERLKKLLFEKKKCMNKYYSQINLLSFNNKDQILKTWDDIKKSLDNIINEENLSVNEDNYESDDEETNEYCKITYKNNTYIFDDNKLYSLLKAYTSLKETTK